MSDEDKDQMSLESRPGEAQVPRLRHSHARGSEAAAWRKHKPFASGAQGHT